MGGGSLEAQCKARLGQTLCGKWTLEGLLGVGGMAAVYVAVHKIGHREAIKILHPEVARSRELRTRFQREAMATNVINHPGAVTVRDVDETQDGCPFLVMELLDGETLGQRATRFGGLPARELLTYAGELLAVLEAAHGRGIVHRDIKLDNLFVTSENTLKVLDFGIAHMRVGPAVTKVGARLGTTAYMAPEQVRGEQVDGRVDLFAVGATLFRLVAKRRLHEANSDAELLTKMATLPAPALESVVPGVDPRLAAIIDQALRFDRNERFNDASSMRKAVLALLEAAPDLSLGVGEAGPFSQTRSIAEEGTEAAPQTTLGTERTAVGTLAPSVSMRSDITVGSSPPPAMGGAGRTVALQTPSAHVLSTPLPIHGTPPPPAASSFAPPRVATASIAPPSLASHSLASHSLAPAYAAAQLVPTPDGFVTPADRMVRGQAVGSSGSSRWPVYVGLISLLLGLTGAGAFFAMNSSSSSAAADESDETVEVEEDGQKKKKKRKKKRKAEEAAAAAAAEASAAAAVSAAPANAAPTSAPSASAPLVNPADPGPPTHGPASASAPAGMNNAAKPSKGLGFSGESEDAFGQPGKPAATSQSSAQRTTTTPQKNDIFTGR